MGSFWFSEISVRKIKTYDRTQDTIHINNLALSDPESSFEGWQLKDSNEVLGGF